MLGGSLATPLGSSNMMRTDDFGLSLLSNDYLPDFFGKNKPKAYGGIEHFGDSLMPHEVFIGLI